MSRGERPARLRIIVLDPAVGRERIVPTFQRHLAARDLGERAGHGTDIGLLLQDVLEHFDGDIVGPVGLAALAEHEKRAHLRVRFVGEPHVLLGGAGVIARFEMQIGEELSIEDVLDASRLRGDASILARTPFREARRIRLRPALRIEGRRLFLDALDHRGEASLGLPDAHQLALDERERRGILFQIAKVFARGGFELEAQLVKPGLLPRELAGMKRLRFRVRRHRFVEHSISSEEIGDQLVGTAAATLHLENRSPPTRGVGAVSLTRGRGPELFQDRGILRPLLVLALQDLGELVVLLELEKASLRPQEDAGIVRARDSDLAEQVERFLIALLAHELVGEMKPGADIGLGVRNDRRRRERRLSERRLRRAERDHRHDEDDGEPLHVGDSSGSPRRFASARASASQRSPRERPRLCASAPRASSSRPRAASTLPR